MSVSCKNCGALTDNPRFCNRSCSAQFNNRKYPKRVSTTSPTRLCEKCGEVIYLKKIPNGRNQYGVRRFCNKCLPVIQSENVKKRNLIKNGHDGYSLDTTKGELKSIAKTGERIRATITRFARAIYFETFPDPKCEICGYNSHVEVCHIIASSKFNDDAKLSEINRIENLIGLCPNHHWEFDSGMMPMEQINARIVQRKDS